MARRKEEEGVPGPGVPAGVVARLLQWGAMVTCRSRSVRIIRLFTRALVLPSGALLFRWMEFTSWKNFSLQEVQEKHTIGVCVVQRKGDPGDTHSLTGMSHFPDKVAVGEINYLSARTTFSKSLKSSGTSFREQSNSSSLILFW